MGAKEKREEGSDRGPPQQGRRGPFSCARCTMRQVRQISGEAPAVRVLVGRIGGGKPGKGNACGILSACSGTAGLCSCNCSMCASIGASLSCEGGGRRAVERDGLLNRDDSGRMPLRFPTTLQTCLIMSADSAAQADDRHGAGD